MIVVCPNHGNEQETTGVVSDGVHLRHVLACGCAPTHEEAPTAGVARLPDEIIPTPISIAVGQIDPDAEYTRIRTLVSRALAEQNG